MDIRDDKLLRVYCFPFQKSIYKLLKSNILKKKKRFSISLSDIEKSTLRKVNIHCLVGWGGGDKTRSSQKGISTFCSLTEILKDHDLPELPFLWKVFSI